VPSRKNLKRIYNTDGYDRRRNHIRGASTHSNFAIRSILVRRTRNWQWFKSSRHSRAKQRVRSHSLYYRPRSTFCAPRPCPIATDQTQSDRLRKFRTAMLGGGGIVVRCSLACQSHMTTWRIRRSPRPSPSSASGRRPRPASSGIRRSSGAMARMPVCHQASPDRCASRSWRLVRP